MTETNSTPLTAPGRTIADRIDHWRSMSWADLDELMRSTPGEVGQEATPAPAAASLRAPATRVRR